MSQNISFLIIGGDLRQLQLAKLLCDDNYIVSAVGFDFGVEPDKRILLYDNIQHAIKENCIVVLPLPYSTDGLTVNAPFSKNVIYINELFSLVSPCQLIVGGRLFDHVYADAGRHGFKIIDYFEREELAVLNAIPTAEGAIQIAMEELPITLHNSKCLITGWGRISKILSKDLTALGARVTACARKYADLAWIKAYGYSYENINNLEKVVSDFDIIFNTVPSILFNESILEKVHSDALIIDLASKPGGVDHLIG